MNAIKNSGIPWVGDIPISWGVNRIAPYASEIKNPNINCEENNALQFKMGTIISKNGGDSKYHPETLEAYNIVNEGDIIINGLNLLFDTISQRIGICREDGVITSAYLALHPQNINNFYLTYLLKAYDNCKVFHGMGKGLRATLSYDEVKRMLIPIPPIPEQQRIVDFLDKKCLDIDKVIAKTKSSIEEYKKLRQSVINEAATKGIRGGRPMKDSGIEWIGEIPQDWLRSKIGRYIKCYKAGPFGSSLITGNLLNEGNILVYTPEHIAKQTTEIEGNLYLPDNRLDEMKQFTVEDGDIVFPIVGSLGRAMVIHNMPLGIINQRLSKFKLRDTLNENYFMWLFGKSSFYSTFIDLHKRGAIIVNLTKEIICSMPITVPPIEEQIEIASYLDSKCAEIDSLIDNKELFIKELESYKKSLIFEYVTGKKKVE